MRVLIVGDESLGHTGLVKRMKNVERIVEDHDPVIQKYMSKQENTKSLKTLVIAGVISFFTGLAIQVIILLNHK